MEIRYIFYGMIIGFSIRKITDKGVSEVTRYVLSSYGGYHPYMTSVASITIQPNPATDYVTVSVDNDRNESSLLKSTSANSEKYEIRLVNLQGKVLKTLQVNDVSESEISLQGLQAGVYYIHILKDGEVIQREKLMKK